MTKWWVQHSLRVYEKHPLKIGRAAVKDMQTKSGYKPKDKRIFEIKSGHEIIYYAKEDQVIVGVFKIISNCKLLLNPPSEEPDWKDVYSLDITPQRGILARPPYYVYYYDMMKDVGEKLKEFKNTIRRGHVAVPVSNVEFNIMKKYIRNYIKEKKDIRPPYITQKLKKEENKGNIGKKRNLELMDYEPKSEQGVVALFVHFLDRLGFSKIIFIREAYPDACVEDKNGNKKYIEFKLYSNSYIKDYLRNPKYNKFRCDYVVCWEHNCRTIEKDVEVIELKTKIPEIC